MWDVIIGYLMVPGQQLLNLLVSILFSVALSAFIAVVYKATHRGMSYEPSLLVTMLVIAPIVTMVMFFIQGNLVLSLGLVGSLSIIRFRTPIKDSRDMVFLFWAIGVGLGCGTYNWTVTIAATLAISLVVMVAFLLRYRIPLQGEFVLVVSGRGSSLTSEIENVLRSYQVYARIRSHQAEEDRWETVYELQAPKADLAKGLVEDINRLDGVKKVSLLAPQLALPV
ncbi:MAG TPA: DUF4956 domain-containing protein [Candidatus Atribacteria bacterium]|nr:DUF4956 domain-containing protein [Candidatus Atribacteria bacterium]HPT79199.1 DUF4956 domain-containing protein [Candidatus Atribacteria bacterium]